MSVVAAATREDVWRKKYATDVQKTSTVTAVAVYEPYSKTRRNGNILYSRWKLVAQYNIETMSDYIIIVIIITSTYMNINTK